MDNNAGASGVLERPGEIVSDGRMGAKKVALRLVETGGESFEAECLGDGSMAE